MTRDFALLLFQPFRINVIIEIDFALNQKNSLWYEKLYYY